MVAALLGALVVQVVSVAVLINQGQTAAMQLATALVAVAAVIMLVAVQAHRDF
jgi:hypothetical protein